MTIEEAREYWSMRLERAEGYSDEHWDAEERHAHKDYVDAMTHAVTALAVCREHEEVKHPKTNGDKIRAMTDEELAEFLDTATTCCADGDSCDKCPLRTINPRCNVITFEKWIQEASEDVGTD